MSSRLPSQKYYTFSSEPKFKIIIIIIKRNMKQINWSGNFQIVKKIIQIFFFFFTTTKKCSLHNILDKTTQKLFNGAKVAVLTFIAWGMLNLKIISIKMVFLQIAWMIMQIMEINLLSFLRFVRDWTWLRVNWPFIFMNRKGPQTKPPTHKRTDGKHKG